MNQDAPVKNLEETGDAGLEDIEELKSKIIASSPKKDFPEGDAAFHLQQALRAMRRAKPNDRSPRDRQIAVAVTEAEKLIAYWGFFIM